MKFFLSILFFTLISFANTTIEDSNINYRAEKIREVIKRHENNITKQEILLKRILEEKRESEESSKKMREEYDKEYLVHRGTYTEDYKNLYIVNWILEHFFLVILLFGGYLYLIYPYFGLAPDKNIKPKHLPPKGFSILQSAILLDKYADDKDNISAIIELEYLGYLKISKANEVYLLIREEKNSEELTIDQRHLLDEVLFSKTNSFIMNFKKYKEAEENQRKFSNLSSTLYEWSIDSGYLKSKIDSVSIPFTFATIAIVISLFFLLYYILLLTHDIGGSLDEQLGAVTVGVAIITLLWTLTSRMNVRKLILFPIFLYWLLLFGTYLIVAHDNFYMWQFWLLILMTALIMAIIYISVDRLGHFTQKGLEAHTHILGLKEFMKNPDKQEIKRLIKIYPNYLEQMSAYAILFEVWDSWLEQFKHYKAPLPKWQESSDSLRSIKYAFESTTVLPYRTKSQREHGD